MQNNNRNQKSSKVYVNNRCVGEVKNGVFSKRISGSKHLLRSPRAIAFDVDSLRKAKQYGAHTLRVTDGETGRVYHSDYNHFMRYSFELNRGYGAQRAMVLERWTVTGGEARNVPLPVDPEPEPIQYSMFS